MVKVVVIWLLVLAFIIFVLFYCKRYSNPYKLIMVFGKKGSGKSTLIAKLAYRYTKKKGFHVYSNINLNISGVRLYDVNLIGDYVFPKKSIVFVDEVGMIWDNRDFKKFRSEVRDYFKLQRHYRNKVYLFSQTFDVDVKLRNLTDYMFMVESHLNIFSVARRIKRNLVIVEPTGESEGRIADGYELEPLFLQLIGFRIAYFTFIPHWTKYFDSFEEMDKDHIPYEEVCPNQESEQLSDNSPDARSDRPGDE